MHLFEWYIAVCDWSRAFIPSKHLYPLRVHKCHTMYWQTSIWTTFLSFLIFSAYFLLTALCNRQFYCQNTNLQRKLRFFCRLILLLYIFRKRTLRFSSASKQTSHEIKCLKSLINVAQSNWQRIIISSLLKVSALQITPTYRKGKIWTWSIGRFLDRQLKERHFLPLPGCVFSWQWHLSDQRTRAGKQWNISFILFMSRLWLFRSFDT